MEWQAWKLALFFFFFSFLQNRWQNGGDTQTGPSNMQDTALKK